MPHAICVDRLRDACLREAKVSANQALEQTRDSVLRRGYRVGCELLNLVVRLELRRGGVQGHLAIGLPLLVLAP